MRDYMASCARRPTYVVTYLCDEGQLCSEPVPILCEENGEDEG